MIGITKYFNNTLVQAEEFRLFHRLKEDQRIIVLTFFMIVVLSISLIIILAVQMNQSKKKVELYINSVKMNPNGSYTVTLGYHNHTDQPLEIEVDEKGFSVTKGFAIVTKNGMKNGLLQPGNQPNALVAIIGSETEIEWSIGNNCLHISQDNILG